MFNLILARRNSIKTLNFLSCFVHKKSFEIEKPLNQKDPSLTLSYLINTCCLSHQSTLSASSKINIKSTNKPDFVIETLKSYDLTDAQITKLLTKHPRLLSINAEKIVKPKLDYFLSLGYSRADLGKFILKNPQALNPSLEKRIKPNIKFLRSFLLNDQDIIHAITRSYNLLANNIQSTLLPNIKTLGSYGVDHANIANLIIATPRALLRNSDKFAKVVQSVKEFGFNPLLTQFTRAVSVLTGLSPLSWERKVEVYKSLGLSQKRIIAAFLKHPQCMALSEDKIRRGVEFFSKEMKLDPSFVLDQPSLLFYSLEKRLIPRCSVMKVLKLKGFVKHYPSASYKFLVISEKNFLEKYVTNYKEQIPEVLDVFKDKLK